MCEPSVTELAVRLMPSWDLESSSCLILGVRPGRRLE